jgi:glucosamine-6-phosphate deaminase
MLLYLCRDAQDLGRRAAEAAAACIRAAIAARGEACVVFPTGASQIEMYQALIAVADVAWPQVIGFHLDEYLNLSPTHPASFRKYLTERLIRHLPFREFHLIDGEADPRSECRRLGELISRRTIDLALVGIGENGHLAFNDPPADFQTDEPYLAVELDEKCRRQQLGEGWFPAFEDVPRRAISMSISQLLKARTLVCTVPDRRKAQAVHDTLEEPVTPLIPASILKRHPRALIFLDPPAAELLSVETIAQYRATE